ncbi:FMN-binding domain-containing protein [Actinoplanes sp. ATCC 53533]|uniref:FMN-binding protein n=1 Tax=Actinoplanes sp. ATCC 53533 TaxID=1288362 RepID=UPI000F7A168B|nr:FMN-binding protein [Actinoplanes sp. ATCC 53533]RSM49323.1 FMN-binding domain-containing protein [Actinoplanes sp. ATCC 53533]
MRRISMWLFSTVAAVVLLFSYRTSTNTGQVAGAGSGSSGTGSTSTATGGKTYTGSTVPTRWGDVQVAITVADGKITDVAVPVYPSENHKDQEINAYALPILRQETLAAQSADIDTVSGATVTSDGYRESLQSALDAAHLS